MSLKTPLYDMHIKYGGKMVDFAGYELPIQYEGIIPEHEAVRNSVGMFDVSHMGKFMVEGEGAEEFVNYLITSDISVAKNNQIQYTPMCYENGRTVDDILVYKYSSDKYLLVVNAANLDKDWNWISSHKPLDLSLVNISGDIVQIALQGPSSEALLQSLVDIPLHEMKYYWFQDNIRMLGTRVLISRTGYTGEDGFELYFDKAFATIVFEKLLESGSTFGIKPCGLGCRDTLRFEAGMPLYGNELSDSITPIEAGLKFFVKINKEKFIGKNALIEDVQAPKRKLVGFEVIDKGIVRHGSEVFNENKELIGFVTTGYKSPTLNKTIGFALIDTQYLGTKLYVSMRGKLLSSVIINKRFYKKEDK